MSSASLLLWRKRVGYRWIKRNRSNSGSSRDVVWLACSSLLVATGWMIRSTHSLTHSPAHLSTSSLTDLSRMWSKLTLSTHFTYQISTPTSLIVTGPYYYCIHPGYFGTAATTANAAAAAAATTTTSHRLPPPLDGMRDVFRRLFL